MRKVVAFTGGSGLLATNLALSMASDFDVYLFLHSRFIQLENVTSVYLDLASISKITSQLDDLKVDLLINCAALTNVETCEKDPETALFVNSTIANNIAISCSECGVKLIHISTDHLYDGKRSFYIEDDPVNPLNVYGHTKACGEEQVLKSCPSSIVLRTNFFGWGPPHRNSFSDFILKNLNNDKYSFLFTDVFFTPVLISQLYSVILSLVDLDQNGIFNVSSSERLSKFEFGYRLASIFRFPTDLIKPSLFTQRPDLIHRPTDMSLSNHKLLSLIPDFDDNINNQFSTLLNSSNKLSSLIS